MLFIIKILSLFSLRVEIGRIFLIILLVFPYFIRAQQTQVYKANVNRILFVLDGSGSMKQDWGGKTKFDRARGLLAKLIDSVERKNPNVEFGVRVFGYEFPREQKNCRDSKLLVPFAKNNAAKIAAALNNIIPKGLSPIAYSIKEGASDFPEDAKSLNSIILITDGEENCEGNPCKVSKDLIDKRITLKPFIVGLNVAQEKYEKFKCMGTFYDTKDETSFNNTVGIIIRQTLNTTTAQINLLDNNGNPSLTNMSFTLYDHYSGKVAYNFVHAMNEKGNPDTLYLDPVGIYDLELHTYPSIRKENIELIPGKHNIIAVDVTAGNLKVECVNASITSNNAQVIVRPKSDVRNILNVQDLNEQENYLSGRYDLEVLTTPNMIFDTTIFAFAENKISISSYGTVSFMSEDKVLASIYQLKKNETLKMVERFEINAKTDNRKLQPGEYYVVYKSKANYESESTKSKKFFIIEGRVEVINLQ